MKPQIPKAPEPAWPDGLRGVAREDLVQSFRTHLDENILDLRVTPMPGDASTRQYHRVSLVGGSPASAILMVLPEACPPEPMDVPFLNIRSHLADLGLPVPGHYFSMPREGVVALEDLGDQTLETALESASRPEAEAWYREALESLIRMQTDRGDCSAFTYAFTSEKFEAELAFFLDHAIEGLWKRDLSARDRAALTGEFRRLSEALVSQGSVFVHRDYHSRNLMVLKVFPKLGILDFQDARLGPAAYDAASLLYDSYVTLPGEFRDALIEYYRSRRENETGERSDRETFNRSLRIAATQRNLKAVGTFAYQAGVLGKRRYLASIPPTLEYVRDHCGRLSELAGLWAILAPLLPDSAEFTACAAEGPLPCSNSSV